jgi:hypothetical protein
MRIDLKYRPEFVPLYIMMIVIDIDGLMMAAMILGRTQNCHRCS